MIEAIYIAARHGEPLRKVEEVRAVADAGLEGDRNYRQGRWPGQNVTFVEAERIEEFNARFGLEIGQDATRRNIVTRGVRLDELVGRHFQIGEVRLRGVELCEPCSKLGAGMATESMPAAAVVKAWVHKAGLRADVLSCGVLRVGMAVTEGQGAAARPELPSR
jgi:MOSC domain-containing protein YiiM